MNANRANGLGQILGHGKLSSLTSGQMAYLLNPGVPGDFNGDGIVDAADYVVWRNNDGTPAGYNTWRANFGKSSGAGALLGADAGSHTVPEPSTLALAVLGALGLVAYN